MKLRRNQEVLIECHMELEEDDDPRMAPFLTLRPYLVAGGPYAEQNRLALIDFLTSHHDGKWTARIVYRFRNRQHVTRWLKRGVRWRKSAPAGWDGRPI